MSVKFRTRASARDKLSSLVEAISASEKRQNEIRNYQKQEKELTEFWKKKGIIYE